MDVMGFRESINGEWGVIKFLGDKGLIATGKRGEINKVITEFLIEHKLPVKKHNPRYRGYYDALNHNALTAQEHWDKFHTWVKNKITV